MPFASHLLINSSPTAHRRIHAIDKCGDFQKIQRPVWQSSYHVSVDLTDPELYANLPVINGELQNFITPALCERGQASDAILRRFRDAAQVRTSFS